MNRICDIIEAKGYTLHMTKDGRVVMKHVKSGNKGFIGKALYALRQSVKSLLSR